MPLRDLRAGDTHQALVDGAILVTVLAVFCAVELLTRGRVRLWARVVEVSIVVGALLFASWSGGVALLPIAVLWLVFTGGLIALALLQPEVTT